MEQAAQSLALAVDVVAPELPFGRLRSTWPAIRPLPVPVRDILLRFGRLVHLVWVKEHRRPVESNPFDVRHRGNCPVRSFSEDSDGVGTVRPTLLDERGSFMIDGVPDVKRGGREHLARRKADLEMSRHKFGIRIAVML